VREEHGVIHCHVVFLARIRVNFPVHLKMPYRRRMVFVTRHTVELVNFGTPIESKQDLPVQIYLNFFLLGHTLMRIVESWPPQLHEGCT
jgi:hypothetical protein